MSTLKSFDLEGVADYIKTEKAKKVIVMTGAGISVSAGIPDFRTPGTGLYYNVQKYNLDRPEQVFDIDYFKENPKPFYEVAKGIYPGQFHPTKTHYFIKLLEQHKILLRNFTQNIDTLEQVAGISDDKLVFAHGSFASAHCIKCKKEYSSEEVRKKVFNDETVKCSECDGYVKPDITFFGENLPQRFFERLYDFEECDLLIVIGTSLVVKPFATLISFVNKDVPRLLINMEKVGSKGKPPEDPKKLETYKKKSLFAFDDPDNKRDIFYKGSCDDAVEKLADLLGWRLELEEMFDAPFDPIKN